MLLHSLEICVGANIPFGWRIRMGTLVSVVFDGDDDETEIRGSFSFPPE